MGGHGGGGGGGGDEPSQNPPSGTARQARAKGPVGCSWDLARNVFRLAVEGSMARRENKVSPPSPPVAVSGVIMNGKKKKRRACSVRQRYRHHQHAGDPSSGKRLANAHLPMQASSYLSVIESRRRASMLPSLLAPCRFFPGGIEWRDGGKEREREREREREQGRHVRYVWWFDGRA